MKSNTSVYDLAVIGAGAAGLSVSYAAARLGLRVALIEQSAMGGECLNTGCVPSKALLHAARTGADWPAAQAAVRAAIAAIAPMDSAERYRGLGATVLHGTARFTGTDRLDVDGAALGAHRIVIATGSRSKIPDFCSGMPYLTNETIWDLPAPPEHLLILGGGPMAGEMAEIFSGFSKVTIAGNFFPNEDPDLVAPLAAVLAAKGVMLTGQRAVGAKPGPILILEDGREISGSHLLIAAGREVDMTELNLAAAGLSAGPNGIKTDAGLRVEGGRDRIFAAGDCADPAGIGPRRYTNVAGEHAGVIIRRAIFRLPARLQATPPARAIYTNPALAQVGLTLAQAGPGARALVSHFTENDRAQAEGETAGLVKLVLDAKCRLVGAGICGPGADEMIGLYALAIASRTKLSRLAGLMLPYPTRSEAGKRAISADLAERLFSNGPKRLARWLARLP
jgi:pyruvate/2-oxoglutarate dehydrogenase complex dihydrolipoamide dehydrogenase (E3) component